MNAKYVTITNLDTLPSPTQLVLQVRQWLANPTRIRTGPNAVVSSSHFTRLETTTDGANQEFDLSETPLASLSLSLSLFHSQDLF